MKITMPMSLKLQTILHFSILKCYCHSYSERVSFLHECCISMIEKPPFLSYNQQTTKLEVTTKQDDLLCPQQCWNELATLYLF